MDISPQLNRINIKSYRERPIYGYTRLRFFNFKLWQILFLITLLIGVVVMVFPRDKMLITYYIEKGMLQEAVLILPEAIRKSPDDRELILIAADIYRTMGDPELSAHMLNQFLRIKPDDAELLLTLADFYEGTRDLQQAANVWEKIVSLRPEQVGVWKKLIEYYAYIDDPPKQVETIVRLIKNEKKLSSEKIHTDSSWSADARKIFRHPLLKRLTLEMQTIAEKRRPDREQPFLDELLRRLYPIRTLLIRDLEAGNTRLALNTDIFITRILEPFVHLAMIREGSRFAAAMDRSMGHGYKVRLRLIEVMQWNRLDRQAITLLSEWQKTAGDNADLLYRTVELAKGLGSTKQAIAACEALYKSAPSNSDLQKLIADLYLEGGRTKDAFEMYKQIFHNSTGNKEIAEKMIQVAGFTGNHDIMTEAARLIENHYPLDPAFQKKAAGTFLEAGAQKEAVRSYEAYLRLNPSDPEAESRLAELYTWTGQPKKAYVLYAKMVKSDKRITFLDKMIDAAGATGDSALLEQAVVLGEAIRPKDPILTLKSAKVFTDSGKYKTAISLYRQYLESRPEDETAADQLAELYRWTGQSEKAAAFLAAGSDRDPNNDRKALAAGEAFVEAGKTEAGIAYLERASRLRPDDFILYQRLATYYGWTGQTDKMIDALKYLEASGHIREPEKITLAQAYMDQKAAQKALYLLEPYQNRSPLPIRNGLMLASAYEGSGKMEAAIKIYQRLAKENADDATLLAKLGNHALWLQKTTEALSFFKSALKKDSKNLTALKGSGQIYAWNNDPERAIEKFKAYNRIDPNDYEVRYQLGELYFENQREGEAFLQYRKAMRLIQQVKTSGKQER
jgi:tetratricopeptide (TPR) repeat protein